METWDEPRAAAEQILKETMRRRVLASRNVEVSWNEDGVSGGIFAGFRRVGSWRKIVTSDLDPDRDKE
jgi:hypothetical protein